MFYCMFYFTCDRSLTALDQSDQISQLESQRLHTKGLMKKFCRV